MQANCKDSNESFALSEQKRVELQAQIKEAGLKIQEDTKVHSTRKDELTTQASDL